MTSGTRCGRKPDSGNGLLWTCRQHLHGPTHGASASRLCRTPRAALASCQIEASCSFVGRASCHPDPSSPLRAGDWTAGSRPQSCRRAHRTIPERQTPLAVGRARRTNPRPARDTAVSRASRRPEHPPARGPQRQRSRPLTIRQTAESQMRRAEASLQPLRASQPGVQVAALPSHQRPQAALKAKRWQHRGLQQC